MNATLIATLAGIGTALCWGSSDYLSARTTKKFTPMQINFTSQVSSFLVACVLFLFAGIHITSTADLARIAISSILINLAYLTFVKALARGAVGVIVPLGNIYPLFTILLSLLFLKLHFSTGQLSAMVIVVLGAVLLAYEKNHQNRRFRELHRETMLALFAAAIWGVGFFVVSPVVTRVSWQTISITSEIFTIIFVAAMFAAAAKGRVIREVRRSLQSRGALLIGIFGELGALALYFGSGRSGSVLIPAVLSATGPLIASLWGKLFDHEQVGWVKRIGAVLTVAGVIILNVT